MLGCSATTKRWSRPRAAFSSWYLATSALTESASSAANAARSVAEAKRISLSMPSVATGFPAALARPISSPTSPHQTPREREQPARGALVGLARRIGRDRRQRGRRDHVGRRRRLEHALGAVALAALLDELDQPVTLERAQVVVGLLARQPDAAGERLAEPGFRQLGEQPRPDRVQRGLGRGRSSMTVTSCMGAPSLRQFFLSRLFLLSVAVQPTSAPTPGDGSGRRGRRCPAAAAGGPS